MINQPISLRSQTAFASAPLAAVPAELQNDALVDIRTVAGLLGVKSTTTVRARMKVPNGLPAPIRQSPRCTRWRLGDIRAYIAAIQVAEGGTQ